MVLFHHVSGNHGRRDYCLGGHMDALNPGRWILFLALVVALFIGHSYDKHRAVLAAEQAVNDHYQALALQASEAARKKEQEYAKSVSKVRAAYVEQVKLRGVAIAANQSELDRLRDQLSAINSSSTGTDTSSPGRTYGIAGLERDLLQSCAQALVGLAADADQLAARIVGLQDYVKTVCK